MKINIAASHRFHLLDLARELDTLGHDVKLYSYVPTKRAMTFGLKKKCSHSLFYLMLPFLAVLKITKNSPLSVKIAHKFLDFYLAHFMRRCDIYIGLGTVYKTSFIAAQKRFGAITIMEWGSKHIEEQQSILAKIPGVKKQDQYFIDRSVEGYTLVDYIAISSDHVKKSFVDRGIVEEKIIQNPYGVDLSMFAPTLLNKRKAYDIIMVGGWSYRKGCDLLGAYLKNSDLTFLHVGPIIDLPFPSLPNATHIEAVDQKELINYYAMGKVFVLASREEGLAMVQLQALVCGLPIVCTKDTGGRDLRNYLKDDRWIIEMDEFSIVELDRCIKYALDLAKKQIGERCYSDGIIERLDWKSYGIRYDENLLKITRR